MFSPKRILVPTDFSQYSDRAVSIAIDIAKQNGARIYLLHVVGIIQTCAVDYCFDQGTLDALEKKGSDSAVGLIRQQLEKFPQAKSVEIITDVRKGTPYEGILSEQKDKEIDLIVMSSHGKTGLLNYLMGSVADKVIRNAACSVLLVRNPR